MSPGLLRFTGVLAALLAAVSFAQAGYVTVGTINEAGGGGFWDNHSDDGSQLNAGYFLTATGGFTGGTTYIASGNLRSFDPSSPGGIVLSAGSNATGTSSTQMLVEVAGYSGLN